MVMFSNHSRKAPCIVLTMILSIPFPLLGTQEEAAAAYDKAAIEYRGLNAVTNFDISHYIGFRPRPPQPSPIQEPHQVAPPQIQLLKNPDPIDQAAIMDPLADQPWNICMYPTFSSIPVANIALEKSNELHDLFNGTGFEDNIEFFFDGVEDGTTTDAPAAGSHEGKGDEIKVNDGIFENPGVFEGGFLNDFEEGGEFGLMEENLNSSVDSLSYPLPISICS